MDRREIRYRIENWAAWSRGGTHRGADCMTGIVCDSMRRASLGDVWSGPGTSMPLDAADCALVEQAWKMIAPKHKELLRWHYIRKATPGFICRRLGIAQRPPSVFAIELARAEEAIGLALTDLAARRGGTRCAPRL